MSQLPSTASNDKTNAVQRESLAKIRLLAPAASHLLHAKQRERLKSLLGKYSAWNLSPPHVMLSAYNDEEVEAANGFVAELPTGLCQVVQPANHAKTTGHAIAAYRELVDANAELHQVKAGILELANRGGAGAARFVRPFTGGGGTTCGEWTPVVCRPANGSPIKGFMLAAVSQGFCHVRCSFCYLQAFGMDAQKVYLNWEDLETELFDEWYGYPFTINFSEIGGFVEYDEWFADDNGAGSMVQFVIDACAKSKTIPFLLAKIRYPRYLKFRGHVQVGISLMPEPLRKIHAPYGSPADDLLASLAWAHEMGARDPAIRLFVVYEHRDLYRPLLERCGDLFKGTNLRITADVPRFNPRTAQTIARRHPENAAVYAKELDPTGAADLHELGKNGVGEKKIRPPVERQAEIYRWLRETLDESGCHHVPITPCKGDPEELESLVKAGVIDAMPCACHAPCSRRLMSTVQLNPAVIKSLETERRKIV